MKNEKKLIQGLKEAVEKDKDISPRQLSLFGPVVRRRHNFRLGDMPTDFESGYKDAVDTVVPDEAFTPAELLRKHAAGIAPDIMRTPLYGEKDMSHDDVDLQAMASGSQIDRMEFRQEVIEKVENLNANLKEIRKSRKYASDEAKKVEQKKASSESQEVKPKKEKELATPTPKVDTDEK